MTTTSFTTSSIVQAILENATDVASKLLATGLDVPTVFNMTPLMFAMTPKVTRFLLDAGANPNATDKEGTTPLMHHCHSPEAIQLLLDAGANPNAKSKRGITALMLSKSSIVTSLLLNAGARVDDRDYSGATPLCWSDSPDISSILIHAGADVNASNFDGTTPLMLSKNSDSTALLINAGADVNAKNIRGFTALMFSSSTLITALLLYAGADINAQNNKGFTPLMTIMTKSPSLYDLPSFHLLLALDADVNIRDKHGKTLLDIIQHCDLHTLFLILAAGAFLHKTIFVFNSLSCLSNHKLKIAALLSAHASFSNLPPLLLPSSLDLHYARLQIQLAQLQLSTLRSLFYLRNIRYRATQVCIALQALQLPALVTLHILQHLDPNAYKVRMAALWDLITTVKHYHDT